MKPIEDIREDYILGSLLESELVASPFTQFEHWFKQALTAEVMEPTAMVLSTVSAEGCPSSRVVLLKGFDEAGFVFYTNYQSRKGQELNQNPNGALLFFWPELQRQVRIEGSIDQVSSEQSTAYFQSRPRGSQLGAWASPQSEIVPDREFLEQRLEEVSQLYERDRLIPRPPHWGGFVLDPIRIEFWQGRGSRMHDRITYFRNPENGSWDFKRLAP
jgi:pyridoxamine 5'-phosphate oxidase